MFPTFLEALPGRRRTPLVRAVRKNLTTAAAVGGKIVVGCSGGPDSTALVFALATLRESLGLGIKVVAVDHKLRPVATAEAEAVCTLASELGLPAERVAVTVPAGASRMAMARTARYRALAEVAQRCAAAWIAVGHTRDDQAETILMRLLGGAGLTGLSGMSLSAALPISIELPREPQAATLPAQKDPCHSCRLLRPLLSVSRAEVESFLLPLRPLLSAPAGPLPLPLPFSDPTNADPSYLRSRLRHQALPLLRSLAPHLDEHLLHLSHQLRDDADYLNQQSRQALAALGVESSGDGDGLLLRVAALAALPRALRARVLQLAAEVPLGQRHIEALLSLCRSQAGTQALDLPAGLRAERRRGILHLSRRNVQPEEQQEPALP